MSHSCEVILGGNALLVGTSGLDLVTARECSGAAASGVRAHRDRVLCRSVLDEGPHEDQADDR
jgi:hypothetical protein